MWVITSRWCAVFLFFSKSLEKLKQTALAHIYFCSFCSKKKMTAALWISDFIPAAECFITISFTLPGAVIFSPFLLSRADRGALCLAAPRRDFGLGERFPPLMSARAATLSHRKTSFIQYFQPWRKGAYHHADATVVLGTLSYSRSLIPQTETAAVKFQRLVR